jgi:uncharacterized damage-inducible protein DinB
VNVAATMVVRDRGSAAGPLSVLGSLLAQLRDVIALLPVHCYCAQPAPRVSGSVGAHVRHTLDHVSALLAAVSGDELRYEHRTRGTGVEAEPLVAVSTIDALLSRLDLQDEAALDRTIAFATLLEVAQPVTHVRTTLAREAAFVVQHTIHHFALIAILLAAQGVRVPDGFGVAPSTQRARLAG